MADFDRGGPGSGHGLRDFESDDPDDLPIRPLEVWDPEHPPQSEAQFDASARFAAEKRVDREKKQRAKRRRIIVVSVACVAAVAAAIPLTRAVMREAALAESLRQALDQSCKPVIDIGFTSTKEWLDVPSAGLAIDIPADSCSTIAAIQQGSAELLKVRVERPKSEPLEGKGVVWCTCDPERVTVKYSDTSLQRVALRWLGRHASEVGGAEVLATRNLAPFGLPQDPTSLGCSDAAFKVWAGNHREGDAPALDPKGFNNAKRLVEEGFSPAGLFAADKIFAVVVSEPELCYLVVPDKPGGLFSLRADDGKRLAAEGSGAAGWCAYGAPRTYSLWRAKKSTGDVVVVRAPADKVGGLTGLREASRRLGFGEPKLFFEENDLQPDAVAALKASTVSPPNIVLPDTTGLAGKLDNFVASFSLGVSGSYFPEVSPTVPFACWPEIEPKEVPRSIVCAQARPQLWKSDATAKKQGAAESKYPFWLVLFSGVADNEGLKAAARVMAFARRMNLLGFEPSTIDGVIDQADGAMISGRASKELAVSVGMVKHAPWLVPLTDGAAWTLEGPVSISKVPMGKSVKVRGSASLGGDPAMRRVVVWRK